MYAMAESVFHDANPWDFNLPNPEEFHDANLWNFNLPNTEQFQAASALKGFNDQEVLCWLAFSRKGGFQLPTSDHRLPQKVVDAYGVLQGYDDLVVLRWLHEAQSIGRSCGF